MQRIYAWAREGLSVPFDILQIRGPTLDRSQDSVQLLVMEMSHFGSCQKQVNVTRSCGHMKTI